MSTVGGGVSNTANGLVATIGGGYGNRASTTYATVPGGAYHLAQGDVSFAAGYRAKANNTGSFAWADSTDGDFSVNNDNRFGVRASGGVYLYTSSDLSTGSYLAAGSGTWTSVSDRNAKRNLQSVDGKAVLDKLAAIPVSTWNYKSEADSIRHMGPMAQDIYAAFYLGDSDKSIGVVDADGISMAAIQGLNEIVREKDARITQLEERVRALEATVNRLAAAKK